MFCNRINESHIELDALGQWEIFSKVDGAGLSPHVLLPRVASAFSAASGLFLAAESA